MAITPPSNLPPDSQPWGRYVDSAIAQLQFDANKAAQDTANSFSAVNNALTAISGQISTISAVAADAAAAAAAANSALSQILSTGSVGGSAAGVSFSGSNTFAAQTITVPAGYTKALVHCVVTASGNVVTGIGQIDVRAQIAGVAGGTVSDANSSIMMGATATAIRSMTGLTGGGTFTVAAVVTGNTTSWSNTVVNVDAIVIFTK